ncbi:ThyX-like thymidylate synthase [Microbacterium phage MementoMori]|uniref:ThyX-like thymidylate synthase n=1 Tax=Microbacterium phage MementoMori TaxID=2201436 RepID=A0A2Z4Q5E4_9CAUD|nr:ThyX-like thymidylate synthase [Microbacterium phage MementoMori]AWY05262.1 ThyX-like thymidylate synthase [Microbacterium phage MementoMori]
MTDDTEPGALIVAVDVRCPYCHAVIGKAREGWLVGVQHGTGGRHSILTADPAKMRTKPAPLTVDIGAAR